MPVAIIAGATGLVGHSCMEALLADAHFQSVVALVRRPLTTRHAKLGEIITDGNPIPPLPDMPGGAAFCALGTTIRKAGSQAAFREVDFDYPLRLAHAARKAGAGTFVLVSSVGANPFSSNFYLRVKGEIEEEVKKIGFPTVHIFRPSILTGQRSESRPGERFGIVLAQALQWVLIGGLSRYRPIAAAEVGRAMVAAATSPLAGLHVHHFSSIRGL